MLLVLTSRADGDPLSGGFRASLAGCALVTLDIAPLSDADAVTLAGGLFATSAALARKCIERAGGNPLFLEQLLRTAEESDDRLPASLHSLVLARVDRLPERERAALRAAAILGQRFPLAALRHLIGSAGLRLRGAARGVTGASGRRGIAVRACADPRRRLCVADAHAPDRAASRRRGVVRRTRPGAQRRSISIAPRRRKRCRRTSPPRRRNPRRCTRSERWRLPSAARHWPASLPMSTRSICYAGGCAATRAKAIRRSSLTATR